MKKLIASFVLMAMLLIALPIAADAQCSCRSSRRSYRSRSSYASQRYYAPSRSYSQGYYTQRQRPSFYRRHRNLINIGIASGAGALIGGVAKGRRGALIGAGSGAGLGALYTYVLKAKKRRY